MRRELERLMALGPWLAAATLHSRGRWHDQAPRRSHEVAQRARQTEDRRLAGGG